MSSDFEQRLRDARKALPDPNEAVTRRAREHAIDAVHRRRSLRRPAAAILAAALVGLGVAIGALIAPSGRAAPEPIGLGFLPERGWSVLQNGGDGTAAEPALAIAANVELSPDDDSDGLPLSTLEGLSRDGVVIVATFVARGDRYYDNRFPAHSLPLKVSDAAPAIEWGVQVRPERPLGQYQLKAAVDEHNVDINIYFGSDRPQSALLAEAQRQLDRLVVRADPVPAPTLRPGRPAPAVAGPSRLVDRTLVCSTLAEFGERVLRVNMTSPKSLETVKVPGAAFLWTRGTSGESTSLAGMEAGPASGRTTGGIHQSRSGCRVTSKLVPLTSRGLPGPPVAFDQYLRCPAGRQVLVRMRAVLDRRVAWRARGDLLTARGNFTTAALAVRTAGGRPIAFFALDAGKAKLWTAGNCTR